MVFGPGQAGRIDVSARQNDTDPVARDAIAPWEVALTLTLLAFGVWLLVRIASRVYEFTLLHTGSRIGWGQLVRLSRGATLD